MLPECLWKLPRVCPLPMLILTRVPTVLLHNRTGDVEGDAALLLEGATGWGGHGSGGKGGEGGGGAVVVIVIKGSISES